jgi:hypothetical protein
MRTNNNEIIKTSLSNYLNTVDVLNQQTNGIITVILKAGTSTFQLTRGSMTGFTLHGAEYALNCDDNTVTNIKILTNYVLYANSGNGFIRTLANFTDTQQSITSSIISPSLYTNYQYLNTTMNLGISQCYKQLEGTPTPFPAFPILSYWYYSQDIRIRTKWFFQCISSPTPLRLRNFVNMYDDYSTTDNSQFLLYESTLTATKQAYIEYSITFYTLDNEPLYFTGQHLPSGIANYTHINYTIEYFVINPTSGYNIAKRLHYLGTRPFYYFNGTQLISSCNFPMEIKVITNYIIISSKETDYKRIFVNFRDENSDASISSYKNINSFANINTLKTNARIGETMYYDFSNNYYDEQVFPSYSNYILEEQISTTGISPTTAYETTGITPTTSIQPTTADGSTTSPIITTGIQPTTSPIPTTSYQTTGIIPTTSQDPTTSNIPTTSPNPTTADGSTTSQIITTGIQPTTADISTTSQIITTGYIATTADMGTTNPILTTGITPTTAYIATTAINPTTQICCTTANEPTTSLIPTTAYITTSIIPTTSYITTGEQPTTAIIPTTNPMPTTANIPTTLYQTSGIPPTTSLILTTSYITTANIPTTSITPTTSIILTTSPTPTTSYQTTGILPTTQISPTTSIIPTTLPSPTTNIIPTTSIISTTNPIITTSIIPTTSYISSMTTSASPSIETTGLYATGICYTTAICDGNVNNNNGDVNAINKRSSEIINDETFIGIIVGFSVILFVIIAGVCILMIYRNYKINQMINSEGVLLKGIELTTRKNYSRV